MYCTISLYGENHRPTNSKAREGVGELPDQIKLPSTPAGAQQRHRGAFLRAAARGMEASVETHTHVVCNRSQNNQQQTHVSLKKATSFIPAPCLLRSYVLRALTVPTALK
jgi:hypothetical protein